MISYSWKWRFCTEEINGADFRIYIRVRRMSDGEEGNHGSAAVFGGSLPLSLSPIFTIPYGFVPISARHKTTTFHFWAIIEPLCTVSFFAYVPLQTLSVPHLSVIHRCQVSAWLSLSLYIYLYREETCNCLLFFFSIYILFIYWCSYNKTITENTNIKKRGEKIALTSPKIFIITSIFPLVWNKTFTSFKMQTFTLTFSKWLFFFI